MSLTGLAYFSLISIKIGLNNIKILALITVLLRLNQLFGLLFSGFRFGERFLNGALHTGTIMNVALKTANTFHGHSPFVR